MRRTLLARFSKAACAAFVVWIAGCARFAEEGALHPAWRVAADFPVQAGLAPVAAPSVRGDRIGVGGQDGWFRLLSLQTGAELGRVWLGAPVEASPAATPEGFVVASDAGALVGVDPEGRVRWRREGLTARLGRAAVLQDGSTIWLSADGRVERVDAEGRRLWIWASARGVGIAFRTAPPPLVAGDRVFCALPTGEVVALSLQSGDLLWHTLVVDNAGVVRLDRLKALLGAMVLIKAQANERLVVPVANDALVWLDAATGEVLQRKPIAVRADLVRWGDALFAAAEDGAIYALAPDGEVRWRKALSDLPLVALVRSGDALWALDARGDLWRLAKTGTVLGRMRLRAGSRAPLVADRAGGVLVLTENGALISVRPR